MVCWLSFCLRLLDRLCTFETLLLHPSGHRCCRRQILYTGFFAAGAYMNLGRLCTYSSLQTFVGALEMVGPSQPSPVLLVCRSLPINLFSLLLILTAYDPFSCANINVNWYPPVFYNAQSLLYILCIHVYARVQYYHTRFLECCALCTVSTMYMYIHMFDWFMIAFITWNSNLVPLLEGLYS